MTIYAALSLLSALFTFSVGLFVYLKSSRGKLTTVFFLFAISVSVLSFSQFQMRLATDFETAYLWSKIMSIWPYTLILAIHFIWELNRKKQRSMFFYFILYLPGIILSYIQFSSNILTLDPVEKYWGWSMQYNNNNGFIQNGTVVFLVSYWVLVLVLLAYYYKKFIGKAKTQVLYICIGFSINFIIALSTDVLFPLLGIDIPEFGSQADIFTFSLIAYGIWSYDLFNMREDALSNKLFSSISNYLLLVDGNKNILEINNKLLNRLHYTNDEIVGQNLSVILEEKSEITNPLSKHIDKYSSFENKEVLFKTKDGHSLPLTFTASYVKLNDNIKPGLIYVGVEDGLKDVGQQLYSENIKQTNFLAEAALDLVKFLDVDEIYQYLISKIHILLQEKAIVIYTEVNEDSDILNWEIKGIKGVHSHIEELGELLGLNVNKLKGLSKTDYIADFPDGKLGSIDLKIADFTNGIISKSVGEKIIKIFGIQELNVISILHDNKISGIISILSRKKTPPLNIELIESFVAIASMVLKRKYFENELSDLNDMQTKLFSVIGHDLKTPISNVLSYTDMIINDYDTFSKESLNDFFKSIHRSAYSGLDILNSLLLWSKSVQGGLPLNPVLIDFKEKALEAIEQVMPLAIKKNITISNTAEGNIYFLADENMMITVLRNLLSNAIKFTKLNGHIQLQTTVKNATIYFSISDNGIGMTSTQLNTLFALDKLHIGRGTEGEKGSGFGLLICKDFVEKNGGEIIVKSKLNEGSVFTLVFPLISVNS